MKKYLGIDYGDVRTGLAVNDSLGLIASGIGNVTAGGPRKLAIAIAEICKERGIEEIILGHPINMNGTLGPRSELVKAFAKMLEEGEYTALDFDRYVTTAADCIAALDPEIILHRITGDCPKGLLVAPAWNTDKNRVIDAIRCELLRRGARQGSDFCK